MPKTVLKMYNEQMRKEKMQLEKDELRKILHERKVNIKEQAQNREKDVTLSSKQKRQAKKEKKGEPSTLRKNSISSSGDSSEVERSYTIPGFRSILEHLRRDRHCMLCPRINIESIKTLCDFQALSELESDAQLDMEPTSDASTEPDDAEFGPQRSPQSHEHGPEQHSSDEDSSERDDPLQLDVDDAFFESGGMLPHIACEDSIENDSDIIRFTLQAQSGQEEQTIVLTIPRFYYPDGLTKVIIDEKLVAAMGRVFADDEHMLHSMSALANKVSIGQREGAKLNKQIATESRQSHQQSHQQQIAQMKAVERDKDVREWKRILRTTGAVRQKNQDVLSLAKRDVAIINGELKGKYTHKSSKGLKDVADAVSVDAV